MNKGCLTIMNIAKKYRLISFLLAAMLLAVLPDAAQAVQAKSQPQPLNPEIIPPASVHFPCMFYYEACIERCNYQYFDVCEENIKWRTLYERCEARNQCKREDNECRNNCTDRFNICSAVLPEPGTGTSYEYDPIPPDEGVDDCSDLPGGPNYNPEEDPDGAILNNL